MDTIKITIERSKDAFWAYAPDVPNVVGGGSTVAACKQDVLHCIETLQEIGEFTYQEGSYTVEWHFDTESLLTYYKGIFSATALERITGINQKQVHHYAAGLKKPREAQRKKIEAGLHRLAEELLTIRL